MTSERMASEPVVLAWEEPPPPRRSKGGRWDKAVQQLMARPGEYGYIGEFPANGPGQFSGHPAFKKHGIEVVKRSVEGSNPPKDKVWARYTPQDRSPQ